MGDTKEVFVGITRKEGVTYSCLTPNMKGFEAALVPKTTNWPFLSSVFSCVQACGVKEVAVFAAASEAFSQKSVLCVFVCLFFLLRF